MKKYFIYLLTLICLQTITNELSAQQGWMQGQIITLENDTIAGYLDVKSNIKNAQFIDYKKTETGEVKRYEPETLNGYIYPNGYHISKTVQWDTLIPPQKRFLRIVVLGEAMSFYIMKDEEDEEVYFIEKEGKLHTLPSEKLLRHQGFSSDKEYNKHFYGTMIYLFSDCPSKDYDMQKLIAGATSITKLVTDYNLCKNKKSKILKENTGTDNNQVKYLEKKTKVKWLLKGGMSHIKTLYGPTYWDENNEVVALDPVTRPMFGVATQIQFARLSNSVVFQPEVVINFRGAKTPVVRCAIVNPGIKPGYCKFDYRPIYLNAGMLLKYKPDLRVLRPVLGIGLHSGAVVAGQTAILEVIEEGQNDHIPIFYAEKAGVEVGPIGEAGLGIKISKALELELMARYEFNVQSKSQRDYSNALNHVLNVYMGIVF